jgi:hypothetical protein
VLTPEYVESLVQSEGQQAPPGTPPAPVQEGEGMETIPEASEGNEEPEGEPYDFGDSTQ